MVDSPFSYCKMWTFLIGIVALFVIGIFTCDYKWEQRLYDNDE